MKKKIILLALTILCLAGCFRPEENKNPVTTTTATSVQTKTQETTTDASTTKKQITTTTTLATPKNNSDFVRIKDYIPDIYTDLRYATTNNFTKQKIYDFNEPWLRYGTVKKLMQVQNTLKEKGYSLKVWDAFRPVTA